MIRRKTPRSKDKKQLKHLIKTQKDKKQLKHLIKTQKGWGASYGNNCKNKKPQHLRKQGSTNLKSEETGNKQLLNDLMLLTWLDKLL